MSQTNGKGTVTNVRIDVPGRRRTIALIGGGTALLVAGMPPARAATKVRIGLPTKTWWPTVIAETAAAQGLFAKNGIDAELTIYRSGGEAVEALAGGAADVIPGLVSQVGTGRKRGVNARLVSLAIPANTGWKLMVTTGSPIKSPAELAGRKVGITAAGSLSDLLALWTRAQYKIDFTSVPLGGGGLVPNLLSGNVDAAVVYSPLSFQIQQANQGRELLNYTTAIPPHMATGWMTTDGYIAKNRDALQGTLRALYGAVRYMHDNADAAVKIIADVNKIPVEVAKAEYAETFRNLSANGMFSDEQVRLGYELAQIGGFKDMVPVQDVAIRDFVPVR
jgi:ABC-type nitrate/sulfonate/bicarbonate transport system substrate-binding protein